MSNYGAKIKQLREEREMSQEQLAYVLDVATSTVGMWERCERSPRDDVKKKIADFFGKSVQFIFFDD